PIAPAPFLSSGKILSVAALSTSKSFFLVKYIRARLNEFSLSPVSLFCFGCFVSRRFVPKRDPSNHPPMAPPATYPVFLRNLRRDKSVCSLSPVLFSSSANMNPPYCAVLRSEEHTSELQSRFDLVCRLLLE